MPDATLGNGALYIEILAAVVAVGLAALVSAGLRRLLKGSPFLRRLILPAVFTASAFLTETPFVRGLLPLRPRFYDFARAGLVFFGLVFLVCLVDASIQALFARRKEPFPVPGVLHGFTLAVLYLILIFVILNGMLGINITPFLATSAILTAVLGLALQGVLGNILAGLSLHFTRSFSRGDWVKVGETEGIVMETNWRETRILDRASNIVVVPNNLVASGLITNFSQPDSKAAIVFSLKIGFETPPALVIENLKQSAREVADVLTAPAPVVHLMGYDDVGVSYLLKFWIRDYQRKFTIMTDVAQHAWYKFKRLGIEIPMPLNEQMVRMVGAIDRKGSDDGAAKDVERTSIDLGNSAFLRFQEGEKAGQSILSEAEVRDLSALARRVVFTRGEVLFRQGDRGETCYVVVGGKVTGKIVTEDAGKSYTSEFHTGPGGIVGEMSLFTGMPRTATIVVEEEAELIEIGAAAFAEILGRNPGLADSVAETVSARNRNNIESLKKIKELSLMDLEAGSSKKSVLDYLKKLIGIHKKA
jgi:small-conductance mechanosensitive channel/CRP-like cAMP-binding protein